jgi:hypothetical protein
MTLFLSLIGGKASNDWKQGNKITNTRAAGQVINTRAAEHVMHETESNLVSSDG